MRDFRFRLPFRFDRNSSGGGVIVYVWNDIPSKQLTKHKLTDNVEGVFIEVNLRKIQWLIFGTYRPLSQPVEYFFKHVGYALDAYGQTYEKFLLAGDFNTVETEPSLSEFLIKHGRRVNFERGCRINEQKGTNVEHSFQNNNIQKVFLSVIIYHINRYIYIYIHIYIYIYIY